MITYVISGETYGYRDMLARNGLKFDAATKTWTTQDRAAAYRMIDPTYAGRRAPKAMRVTEAA